MATASDIRELLGYRALVTGGTQGIGAAVTARLREAGATVLVAARKPPSALASDDLFVAADVATVEGCTAVASASTWVFCASVSCSTCVSIAVMFGPPGWQKGAGLSGACAPANCAMAMKAETQNAIGISFVRFIYFFR